MPDTVRIGNRGEARVRAVTPEIPVYLRVGEGDWAHVGDIGDPRRCTIAAFLRAVADQIEQLDDAEEPEQ